MSKLYDLSMDFEMLYTQLDGLDPEDENYEELVTAYFDTIEGIEIEFGDKAENLAVFIKRLDAVAAIMKEEADRLTARRRTAENKSKRLKDFLKVQMDIMRLQKIQRPKAQISIRNNAESVHITDLHKVLDDAAYLKPRKWDESEVNKTAVKEALRGGVEVPGAELVRTQSVIIK